MTPSHAEDTGSQFEADRRQPPAGPSFLMMAGGTTLTTVSGLLIGIVGSLIVAWTLGPDGKGALYFLRTVPTTLVTLGNLGIGSAIIYRISRGLTEPAVAAAHAILLALVLGLLTAGGTLAVIPPGHPIWGGLSTWVVLAAMSMTPLLLTEQFCGRVLVGKLKVHHRNAATIVRHVLTLALLPIFLLAAAWGLPGAMLAYVLALAAAVALQIVLVWRLVGLRLRFDGPFLRGALGYGLLAWLVMLSNSLVYRVGVFFVKSWLGDRELGFYSVAVQIAQLMWVIPNSVSQVLLPVAAQKDGRGAGYSLKLCRMQIILLLVLGPALAAAAPLAIMAYGMRFMPALWPFYVLLPGVLVYPISKYLAVDLAAEGKQGVPLLISLAGLAVEVALIVLWVPSLRWYGGIVGAGLAATLAYALMALLGAANFVRVRKCRLRDILLPGREDVRLLLSLPARAIRRLHGKRSPKR